LGLSGAPALSRIIGGDRIPTDSITDSLVNYFGFSVEEDAFFRRLVQRERYFQGTVFPTEPALVISQSRAIVLAGMIEESRARQFLGQLGLEPLEQGAPVLASLNMDFIQKSSIGAYNESFICITAKPQKGGLIDSGIYFDCFVSDNAASQAHHLESWKYRSKIEKLELIESSGALEVRFGSKTLFSIPLGRKFSRVDENYELYGYFQSEKAQLLKAKFTIDSIGREALFESDRDVFDGEAHPMANGIFKDLGFQPLKWVIHESLFSLINRPAEFAPKSTF
jgi:hypothetical protein